MANIRTWDVTINYHFGTRIVIRVKANTEMKAKAKAMEKFTKTNKEASVLAHVERVKEVITDKEVQE